MSSFAVQPFGRYDKAIHIRGGEVYLMLDNDDVPPGMPLVAQRIAEILNEHYDEFDQIINVACKAYNAAQAANGEALE